MAQKVQLNAKTRTESGKGAVKRMRAEGAVPAVIYGAHAKPVNIAVGRRGIGEGVARRHQRECAGGSAWWTRAARRTTASR